MTRGIDTRVQDGALLRGAKIQVHGGTPQRGNGGAGSAGDCRIGAAADGTQRKIGDGIGADGQPDGLPACKIGMRLNFKKRSQIPGTPRLWGFPASRQNCSPPDKLVLRNEYNDKVLMVRNKLSQDLYQKVGAPVVRIEFARVSISGKYFGLYTLEERTDEDFLKCLGWDHDSPGTALCALSLSLSLSLFRCYLKQLLCSPAALLSVGFC